MHGACGLAWHKTCLIVCVIAYGVCSLHTRAARDKGRHGCVWWGNGCASGRGGASYATNQLHTTQAPCLPRTKGSIWQGLRDNYWLVCKAHAAGTDDPRLIWLRTRQAMNLV